MEIKIAVGGCRDYNDRKYIFPCLDNSISKLDKDAKIVILSGHCSGVDTVAEEYASLRGYGTMIFPADWKKYGRAAGPIRNKQMVEEADIVIAFWDGRSKGTGSLIDLTKKSGKIIKVYNITKGTE